MSMLHHIGKRCAALAGVSLAATVLAVNTGTAAGDLPKLTYEKFTLPNGLRVILSVDKSAPVVSTFVHYHVGSKNERPDRTGFAHFFEHLMFEGTENIQRHSLDKIVQSAGGNLNAFTSNDETGYQINLPSNQLKLALWIESERMMHARVEDIGVETQRGVVKEERKNRYDNTPYGSLLANIFANVAKGTPYEWTPIGEAQYIDQADIQEFRDFYKKYYVPNNAVLAIVGDIDLAKTKQWVMEYFTDIPRGADIERPQVTLQTGQGERTVEVREPHTPLPALVYGYPGAKKGDADAYALEILSTVLASGESSRLYKDMVDEKRLAVGAQSLTFDMESAGVIGFFAVAHPTTTMDALGAEFDRQIELVKEQGVTEKEFQKARNQIETQFAGRFNEPLDKAMALASYETYFNNPELVNTEIDKYMAVTREDLQRVARKYLAKENRVIIQYYPGAQGG